jgi:ABC-type transport system substrate-binding protein
MEENIMNKKLRSILMMALCLVLVAVMAIGCAPKAPEIVPATFKQAEYNTTTQTMPSNWNELTYADNNDVQIMSYIGSSFFDYDYKFENDQKYNADGSINKAGIVAGAYTTNYSAATKLEDVTSLVDAKWGYTADQKKEGGYAWKITLRDDLKWDDGTPIKAADFVYSMQQQLDPKFMNFRANTYYDTLRIKNAKDYFFSGAPIYTPVVPAYDETPDYSFDINGAEVYLNTTTTSMTLAAYSLDQLINDYVKSDEAKAALKAIAEAANEYGYTLITEENKKVAMELVGYAIAPFGLDWSTMDDATKEEIFKETLFYVSGYGDEVAWDTVGIYSIDSENAIVVCLDTAFALTNKDGSLSYLAAYYMSSLPLVHKEKYEACKIAPANGATLWTSNYNSSLKTTASWGPYKLVEFEAGSHYKLVKNENWYGWNMEQYKNQYNITAINCRKVDEWSTVWMGFLNGTYDDATLDTDNVAEYMDSKHVYYSSNSTGTFGMQLYSNLNVLKNSGNNNGILAIPEFRQAFNLALNRSDIVEKIWPGTAIPCFGLINVAYYYDIENAPTLADGGQYRNTKQAKEGILRAYGFTQGADGKWSSGELKNLELDEAYESLTGYNPTLAKEKMAAAIAELTANAEKYGYDANKNITLVYGSSVDNAKQRFRATYLQDVLDDLTKGTALEDKIDVVFDASAGDKWAEAFRSGKTQIGFGYGFSGNPFNPFDIVGAFVNPDDNLNYHMYWDTSAIDMTLTMPAGDYEGAGQTITMSVQNWYYCLNGLAASEKQAKTYNWGAGFAPVEARLTILSALEELTIKESRSVMLIAESGGSFLGAKFSYFSDVENVFMGFGGIRYMEVNYTDAEWTDYVKANNNDLTEEYKKSE